MYSTILSASLDGISKIWNLDGSFKSLKSNVLLTPLKQIFNDAVPIMTEQLIDNGDNIILNNNF